MTTVPERLDHITIATGLDTLTMPWSSRVALLDELRRYEAGYAIHDAFTAVGASSTVNLTNEQKTELLRVIRKPSSRCATPSRKTCTTPSREVRSRSSTGEPLFALGPRCAASHSTGCFDTSAPGKRNVAPAHVRRALRLTRLRHIGTPTT